MDSCLQYVVLFLFLRDTSFQKGLPWWLKRLKRLPAMRETWVRALGQEDPLEKEMATHSSILAQRIPWTEEPVGYSPRGRKESDTTERLNSNFLLETEENLPLLC